MNDHHASNSSTVAAPTAKGSQQFEARAPAGRARILLVDDEASILASLQRVLRRERYDLVTAQCVTEARRCIKGTEFDLIVSDHRMPDGTGIELLEQVRRDWPETIRIILSGYSEVGVLIKAINEGAIYKYLTKPWDDEELRINIRHALEQRELANENRRLAAEVRMQNQQLVELNEQLRQRASDAQIGLNMAQLLIDSVRVGLIVVDESGLIVHMNSHAWLIMSGESRDLIGVRARDVLPIPEQTRLEGPLAEAGEAYSSWGSFIIRQHKIQWRLSPLCQEERFIGRVLMLWEAP